MSEPRTTSVSDSGTHQGAGSESAGEAGDVVGRGNAVSDETAAAEEPVALNRFTMVGDAGETCTDGVCEIPTA